jgi:hypothetical protein
MLLTLYSVRRNATIFGLEDTRCCQLDVWKISTQHTNLFWRSCYSVLTPVHKCGSICRPIDAFEYDTVSYDVSLTPFFKPLPYHVGSLIFIIEHSLCDSVWSVLSDMSAQCSTLDQRGWKNVPFIQRSHQQFITRVCSPTSSTCFTYSNSLISKCSRNNLVLAELCLWKDTEYYSRSLKRITRLTFTVTGRRLIFGWILNKLWATTSSRVSQWV